MISYKSQFLLSSYFNTLSLNIQKIEKIKEMMYQSPLYDNYCLFKDIDFDNKGYFNIKDIVSFIEKHSNQIQRQQSYKLFQFLDYNQFARITFTQFEYFLTPFDTQNQLKTYNILQKNEEKQILFDLFTLIIDNFEFQKIALKQLYQQPDFSIPNAFKHLDKYNQNCLSQKNLNEFLYQHDFQLNQDQLSLLFNFIHQKNHISLEHFYQFFYQEYSDNTIQNNRSLKQLHSNTNNQDFNLTYSGIHQSQKYIDQPQQSHYNLNKNREYTHYLKKNVKKNNSNQFQTQKSQEKSQKKLKNQEKQQTSFQNSEKQEFIELLKEIIYNERKLEEQKQILASQKDINIFDVFKIFDNKCEGKINQYQFLDILNSFGLNYNYPTLNNLYNHFDKKNNGFLQFNEFLDLIIPISKEFQHLLKSKQPIFVREFEDFSFKTRQILVKLFDMQIQNQNKAEKIRIKFNQKQSFNCLFKYVGIIEKGFITKNDFRQFLARNKFYPTQNDLISLIQTFSSNQNGQISFKEFNQQLSLQQI